MSIWDTIQAAFGRQGEIWLPSARVLIVGRPIVLLHDAGTGELRATIETQNYSTIAGRQSIIRRAVQSATAPPASGTSIGQQGIINAVAVGTGVFAQNYSRTQMVTELDRVATASSSYSGTTARLKGFFNSSQGNGSLKEIALFGDLVTPPGAINTGTIYAHAPANVTKDATMTMTVIWPIDFNDA